MAGFEELDRNMSLATSAALWTPVALTSDPPIFDEADPTQPSKPAQRSLSAFLAAHTTHPHHLKWVSALNAIHATYSTLIQEELNAMLKIDVMDGGGGLSLGQYLSLMSKFEIYAKDRSYA